MEETPAAYHLWFAGNLRRPRLTLHPDESTCLRQLICDLPNDPVCQTAIQELLSGIHEATGIEPRPVTGSSATTGLFIRLNPSLPREGYSLWADPVGLVTIEGTDSHGLLYGVFAFLQHLRLEGKIGSLNHQSKPALAMRMINQWDNLQAEGSITGTSIERGYAGDSIFDFFHLQKPNPRYRDYARALASIGINHIVVNNVNADPRILRVDLLDGLASLAETFGAYGIRLWTSVNFASPIALDGLPTADPLDPAVRKWWADKATEIYRRIPGFAGFVVKANVERQPGPHDYGRGHEDGANMMGEALAPYGGRCIWRAFVYGNTGGRRGGGFEHFHHLDGAFRDNVILQIKHGPVDFQAQEPVHPLFGALRKTNQMLELMVTQEYTGQSTHAYFWGPQWASILDWDTSGENKPGRKVWELLQDDRESPRRGIAAVSNIGNDLNWCGHDWAQANLYAYGRFAWNPLACPRTVACEWARLTYGVDPYLGATIADLLLRTRDCYIRYTGPFGLVMLHDWMHFRPMPERHAQRIGPGEGGIGTDRTPAGTGETNHYAEAWRRRFSDPKTCPLEYLLYFHRLPFAHPLPDGRLLGQAIHEEIDKGVAEVEALAHAWDLLKSSLPEEAWKPVAEKFAAQKAEAVIWAESLHAHFSNHKSPPPQSQPHEPVTERS